MARSGSTNTSLYLIIEEILHQYLADIALIVDMIDLKRRHSLKRRRVVLIPPYSLLDRIPDQVKHMNRLTGINDTECVSNLRMDRNTFGRLCLLLRQLGNLSDGKFVSVEEQVAIFLGVLAHHKKNRVVSFDFLRSGQTVSHYVHVVMSAILKLHSLLLAKPEAVGEDCTDQRWRWFKGCLGALDGTYINVLVDNEDKPRYRTRKGHIATNTLAVCDRSLRFVYVLTGWEGSAGDSRILRDAVNRNHGLKVPKGNYYLCDNGYASSEGFLTPYKGVRYHLKEWGPESERPVNAQEMFNMRHTRARNVIERAFGIMKMRWGILRSASYYPIKVQNRIIMTCFLLHNFIRTEMLVDPIEQQLEVEPSVHDNDRDHDDAEFVVGVEPTTEWNNKRDHIAQEMTMETGRENVSRAPDCACGKGKMLTLCAGKSAIHAGRYFYKCPANAKHEGCFLWCDEYHRNDPANLVPDYVLAQVYKRHQSYAHAESSTSVAPSITRSSEARVHNFRSDLEAQIVVIFMVVVLVLLGIIIGKLM